MRRAAEGVRTQRCTLSSKAALSKLTGITTLCCDELDKYQTIYTKCAPLCVHLCNAMNYHDDTSANGCGAQQTISMHSGFAKSCGRSLAFTPARCRGTLDRVADVAGHHPLTLARCRRTLDRVAGVAGHRLHAREQRGNRTEGVDWREPMLPMTTGCVAMLP